MSIKEEDGQIIVRRPSDLKKMKSLHGLTRTLINNMIVGVTAGYEKKLEINGVGYRAQKQGKKFVLSPRLFLFIRLRWKIRKVGVHNGRPERHHCKAVSIKKK